MHAYAVSGLMAAAVMLSSILLVIERQYQRDFNDALLDLQECADLAHPDKDLRFSYSRYGEEVHRAGVCFAEDSFEATRIRLSWRIARGSRLNPYAENSLATAFGYFTVTVSCDISGEFRSLHEFIWSPRERRFFLFWGECGRAGCPATPVK